MLLLTGDEVAGLLDLDGLIDALAPAMADLSAGRASAPQRTGTVVQELDGRPFAMPAYVPSQGALVTKLVRLFPRNAGTALPTHQAVIVVFRRGVRRPGRAARRDRRCLPCRRGGAS